MMKKWRLMGTLLIMCFILGGQVQAQGRFLKKIQDKAEDKAIKKIFKEDGKTTDNKSGQQDQNADKASKPASKGMQNTEGEGLITAPPDVNASIKSARSAFDAKNFAEAKYAIKQALLGVELEIGQNVLKSLPDKADGLPKAGEEDHVTSSGTGFIGMTIQRVYRDEKKEFSINILNDANIMTGVNMYLDNPGATSGNENMKQVQFKGYRGILEYDESSGYSLSVPFGQTSLFVVKGVNYKNEAEFMTAANIFDIDKIKSELGEK